jgi:glutamate carboxypeptidase
MAATATGPDQLSALERRVCDEIAQSRGRLLDDLRLHVGLPTGLNNTPGLDESRERFAQRCRGLGASVELVAGEPRPWWIGGPGSMRSKLARLARRAGDGAHDEAGGAIPPTLVCRRLGGGGGGGGGGAAGRTGVLISGHLDTVHDPASPFGELSIAPGGKTATGPGCVDMKGGLVIAMAALEALEACGARVAWTFMFNSDEETGSFHSDAALRREASSGRYGAGVALEPAMAKGELAIARGGSGQFMIEAYGRAAHVGRDFAKGVSATGALAEALLAAHALSDPQAGLCVNISPLWCDQPTNQVADHAACWGNVRYPDEPGGQRLERGLASLSRGAEGQMPRVVVHSSFARPAKPTTPEVHALAIKARVAAESLGQSLPFATTAGVCDGNNLQAAGLATIDTMGVRGGGLHTPQEWIELDSLVERCQLLAVLLLRLHAWTG